MNNKRQIYCLYCEDVRKEASGQSTLLGWFTGPVTLKTYPSILQKLTVVVTIHSPATEPIQTASVFVTLGKTRIHEIHLPESELQKLHEQIQNSPANEVRGMDIQVVVSFGPLIVDEPTNLRASALIDGELFEGNGLRFLAPDEPVST